MSAEVRQGHALRELSLFSGYGGFTLGLRLAGLKVRTVCYVEIEPYCQEIIKARIRDELLDDAPIWDDIRIFRGEQFRGLVDIVTGGFPCQPYSVAGQRRGQQDERNLWPDTLRTICQVGCPFILLENVPGIATAPRGDERAASYLGTIVGQLSEAGYDAVWDVVSARDVGANHRRDRWWCLAYTNRYRAAKCTIETSGWWSAEPPLGRVANGVAHRVDRLKALGNGIVPSVVAEFLRRVSGVR